MRALAITASILFVVTGAFGKDSGSQLAACADFKDMDAAYKVCTDLIESTKPLDNDELGNVYLNRAALLLQRHDFARSRLDLLHARDLLPNSFEPLHWLGAVSQSEGDNTQAIQFYSMALALNPDAPGTRNNRALLYWASGQIERAIEDREETIRRNPNHAPSYQNRAMERAALGQIKPAMMDFKNAYDLRPSDFIQRCLASAILAANEQNQGLPAVIAPECQAKLTTPK